MSKFFTINNKRYTAKEFTFGTIRQFEGLGLAMSEIQKKPMTMVSAYLSYCGNMDIDKADEEINEHVINGGNFDEVLKIIGDGMIESRFFQALNKKQEENPIKEEKTK